MPVKIFQDASVFGVSFPGKHGTILFNFSGVFNADPFLKSYIHPRKKSPFMDKLKIARDKERQKQCMD
jgi:hypothetical protein